MMEQTRRSPTASKRSKSTKAQLQRSVAHAISAYQSTAQWTQNGFVPDLGLLGRVLALTDPKDVRGGSVATALDLWAAATLRAAGIDSVVPRDAEPFFISHRAAAALSLFPTVDSELDSLLTSIQGIADDGVARELTARYRRLENALKRVRMELERGTTAVLGESRRKQVDVFVADWDRGLELLISTKSFALAADPREVVKNLPNRWEEFDGDLKNLRGRFPLAAIGALTIVPSVVLRGTLPAFVDMMAKLTAPGRPWVNSYDRAAIIVVEPWNDNAVDSVRILNDSLDLETLPEELRPETFFDSLLTKLLERSPITEHEQARLNRARAMGLDVDAIATSVNATQAISEETPTYAMAGPDTEMS